jgi:tRNA(fMet)-specific endonuclease VapC
VRKILLDTNAYIHLLAGDQAVLDVLSEADTVLMSIFVLAKLCAGFKGGNRESVNRSLLRDFLRASTVRILSATEDIAEIFAKLKQSLKVAGTPVPINDLWIASHAVENGAQVVTYDAHFRSIPGVLLWR